MGEAMRSLLKLTSSRHRPWQVALAIALGFCCGLMPKANLSFLLIAGLCYVLPIHLTLATGVCLATSLLAPRMEATLGQLGMWSLTHPQLQDFWLRLDAYPLLPWLSLHNTVVHGSLLLGLVLLIPLHFVLLPVAHWLLPAVDRRPLPHSDLDFVKEAYPHETANRLPAELSNEPGEDGCDQPQELIRRPADNAPSRSEIQSAAKPARDTLRARAADPQAASELSAVRQLESLLDDCHEEKVGLDAEEVVMRGAHMAELVDQLLSECAEDWGVSQHPSECRAEMTATKQPAPALVEAESRDALPPTNDRAKDGDAAQRVDNGTPGREHSELTNDSDWAAGQPQLEFFRRLDSVNSHQQSPHRERIPPSQRAADDQEENSRQEARTLTDATSSPSGQDAVDTPKSDRYPRHREQTGSNHNEQPEEALRYLLRHLKATNDQV